MKNKSKTMIALALNLLVFPGTGHLLLGRLVRGLLWAAAFGAVLVGFLGVAATQMSKLMEVMNPNGEPNFDTGQLMLGAGLGLACFVLWGLVGLDTFLLARQLPAAAAGEPASEDPVSPASL
ncbi:MAG: hypothetical protein U0931_17675 [Vulcanimicrobiota bacterium]